MGQIRERKNKEKDYFVFFFILYINALLIVDGFRMIFGEVLITTGIQYVIYVSVALFCYHQMIFENRFKLDISIFILAALLLGAFLFSYIINPVVAQGFGYMISFTLLRSIPGFYLCFSLNNKERIKNVIEKQSNLKLLWIVYAIYGSYYITMHTQAWSQYSMPFGYNLVIPACLFFYYFTQERNIINIGGLVLLIGIITLRGSRGALICCLMASMIIYIFCKGEERSIKRILRIFIIFCAIIVISLNIENVGAILSKIMPSSRTISLLANNFSFDSGRSSIRRVYLDAIQSNPFVFRGVLADRTIGGNGVLLSNYPHHLCIEIIYQFGIVIGSILLFTILFCIVRGCKNAFNINDKYIYVSLAILLATGFLKLFFSSSYLVSIEFFMLMGLLVRLKRLQSSNDYTE
ncbi:hypothetical protein SAMN04487934_108113 [Eubacterium ruminantium]|nr:hypothetical protein SAMN04487934_108113 [Eubacterium ruminantium]